MIIKCVKSASYKDSRFIVNFVVLIIIQYVLTNMALFLTSNMLMRAPKKIL